MARPTKQGLDYFPFDVDLLEDEKLDFLREQYGAIINDVYISLLCFLYKKKGYYIPYETEAEKQDCIWFIYKNIRGGKYPVKKESIPELIEACVARGLFSSDHYPKIITSERAQATFYSCTVDRTDINVEPEKWILTDEQMGKLSKKHSYYLSLHSNSYSTEKPSKSTEKPSKSTEKLLNKSKVKESKEEKIYKKESEFSEEEVESTKATQTEIPFLIAEESSLSDRVITESEIEEYFKKIYEIYPRKVSKIRAKETFEHKLRGYSSDEGHKIAQKIYKTVKHQAEVWSEENDGTGRRWEMIPHFSTWLNDNVENSPKFRRGKG